MVKPFRSARRETERVRTHGWAGATPADDTEAVERILAAARVAIDRSGGDFTIAEVARELGFRDELYFSRLFKRATGSSPTFFREFETAIRGGSNLSMPSAQAPIPHPAGGPET